MNLDFKKSRYFFFFFFPFMFAGSKQTFVCLKKKTQIQKFARPTTPRDQLYDRISSSVINPLRAPPGDAISRCRDVVDAISSAPGHKQAREKAELINLLGSSHIQVSWRRCSAWRRLDIACKVLFLFHFFFKFMMRSILLYRPASGF